MSIDRLSSSSALIAALRAQAAKKGERTARAADTPASGKDGAAARSDRDVGALRRELVGLVEGVSVNDAAAVSAARRRFVRAVLLWEFGTEFREHSEWQPMLDTLIAALESNATHQDDFAKLILDLQRGRV